MENEINVEVGDFVECVRYIEASTVGTEVNSHGIVQTTCMGPGLRKVDFEGAVESIRGNIMTIIGPSGSAFGVHKNKIVNVRKAVHAN